MTPRQQIALATLGSAALLLGAFAFQHLGGLAPCKLCIWQRYPHGLAVALGAVALVIPAALLVFAGALSALTSAGIGLYHVGVEQGWWEGPASCSGAGDTSSLTADQLFDQIMGAPMIRCDDIAWSMGGISMAGWNMILSLILAAFWFSALKED